MSEMIKTIYAPVNFTILDEEQRIVEGYLGDDKVDIDGHFIPKEYYIPALEDFKTWGNIREMHKDPVGILVSAGEKAWNHVVVKVVDDRAWNLVKNGVYKGFSIGARVFGKKWVDVNTIAPESFGSIPSVVKSAIIDSGKVLRVGPIMIGELSLVDRPINPRALFTAIKGQQIEDAESVPVLDVVYEAQSTYYKGMQMMNENEMNQEDTTEVVAHADTQSVEDVASVATSEVSDKGESETVDDGSVEEAFDYKKGYEDLTTRVDEIAAQFAGVKEELSKSVQTFETQMAGFTKAVADLTTRIEGILQPATEVENAVEDAVEDVESEERAVEVDEDTKGVGIGIEDVVFVPENTVEKAISEVQSKLDNIETVIQAAVKKALAEVNIDVTERQNSINKGESTAVEDSEPVVEFEKLSKHEKARYIAAAQAVKIARR